jgi:hypothetical protein
MLNFLLLSDLGNRPALSWIVVYIPVHTTIHDHRNQRFGGVLELVSAG